MLFRIYIIILMDDRNEFERNNANGERALIIFFACLGGIFLASAVGIIGHAILSNPE